MAIFHIFSPTSMGSHVCFPKRCKLVWGSLRSLRSLQRTAPTRNFIEIYNPILLFIFPKSICDSSGYLDLVKPICFSKPQQLTWSHCLSPVPTKKPTKNRIHNSRRPDFFRIGSQWLRFSTTQKSEASCDFPGRAPWDCQILPTYL